MQATVYAHCFSSLFFFIYSNYSYSNILIFLKANHMFSEISTLFEQVKLFCRFVPMLLRFSWCGSAVGGRVGYWRGGGEFWSKSVPFTPVAHFRPVSPVQAEKDLWGGTIWQDAVCHVGYLALPTCEWPDASQPSPLSLSWD